MVATSTPTWPPSPLRLSRQILPQSPATLSFAGRSRSLSVQTVKVGDRIGSIAQLVRAPALQAGGRGFESLCSHPGQVRFPLHRFLPSGPCDSGTSALLRLFDVQPGPRKRTGTGAWRRTWTVDVRRRGALVCRRSCMGEAERVNSTIRETRLEPSGSDVTPSEDSRARPAGH